MQPLQYKSAPTEREQQRGRELDECANPRRATDVLFPAGAVVIGLLVYLRHYHEAWPRLTFGGFVAASTAISLELLIEFTIGLGVLLMIGDRLGCYLGKLPAVAMKILAVMFLCDALWAWLLPHFYDGNSRVRTLNGVIFVDLFIFPLLLIATFRMDNETAKRAAPLLAVTFCAAAIFTLVFFSKPLLAAASAASRMTSTPVKASAVPWDHPTQFRWRRHGPLVG